jgi:hypothetical protein
MVWIRLYVGSGKLRRASKACRYVGRRPMGGQKRRLGVDAGTLAISEGEHEPPLGPIAKSSTLMHRRRLMMREVPHLNARIRFFMLFRLSRLEALISG